LPPATDESETRHSCRFGTSPAGTAVSAQLGVERPQANAERLRSPCFRAVTIEIGEDQLLLDGREGGAELDAHTVAVGGDGQARSSGRQARPWPSRQRISGRPEVPPAPLP